MIKSVHYDRLKEVIEETENSFFGPVEDMPSDSAIERAESLLGVAFPESYKRWLKETGYGEVSGYPVLVVNNDPNVKEGDIVHYANLNAKNIGCSAKERLYIYQQGHHEAYFDTTNMVKGEYQVIEDNDGNIIKHENFIMFLIALVEFYE